MSLQLDPRQRAMLLEMGVQVWWPASPTEEDAAAFRPVEDNAAAPPMPLPAATGARRASTDQSAVAPATASRAVPPPDSPPADASVRPPAPARPVAAQTLPTPTQVTPLCDGIAGMDWPALTHAIQHCQACAMCLGRRAPVLRAPSEPTPCDWLVVGDPPDEEQERAGQPFVGDAGVLLDQMLRAIGVQRWDLPTRSGTEASAAGRAYLSLALKCRPALMRAPDAAELALCASFLRREIALTQPKVILTMGRFAMQLLLSETPPEQARLPLGKLRGQVWRFAGVPLVVTYPPSYLLRNGQDKDKAWADLCLASAVARGDMPSP